MKNNTTENHQEIVDHNSELTITKEQYDRLFGNPLNLEIREGRQVWVAANQGWKIATRRQDGSWAIRFDLILSHDSRHGSFLHWMMKIIREEVYMGHHNQKSLDDSLSLCEKLIPNKGGWVSGSALHEFMGETKELSWWYEHVQYMVEQSGMPFYRHTKLRFATDRSLASPFKVNTLLASQIALSAPTLRGNVFRQAYFTLETALLNPQRL